MASSQRPPIIVAWVDQGIGETGMHKYIKDRFETLSPLISQWLYFDCSDHFTSYVENNSDVRLISVMSGGMSRLLIPKLSHHHVLHSFYVFCVDVQRAREAMGDEIKVKGVFNIEDDLYEQMADDLAKVLLEDGVALARLDRRSEARTNYEEAKRLLNFEAKRVEEDEKKRRTEELDGRIDQLLV